MAKKKGITLPKNALNRISIGQSFAEYDIIREDPTIFVPTAASLAAEQQGNSRCFFVGRRGAGKTAVVYHLCRKQKRVITLTPKIFDLIDLPLEHERFNDTRQRPFKSLTACFERAIMCEVIGQLLASHLISFPLVNCPAITKDRNLIEGCDFDLRLMNLIEEVFTAYASPNKKLWLRQINRSKAMRDEIKQIRANANFDFVLLIDRIDESWDGSDSAVVALMALMHATVRLIASCPSVRPYIFIRENIYDRIQALDNEFSRLETSVIFLDWSEEKLMEMVERRLNRPFSTKLPLGGDTWEYFFEGDPSSSRRNIFDFCQRRPRDVLIFLNYIIDAGVNAGNTRLTTANIESAQKRYSLNRLKELGDEYAENFPNIALVLQYFYGLTTEYTVNAIEQFLQRLLIDKKVSRYCGDWFFDNSTPHLFVQILFHIGFIGIRHKKTINYKGSGEHETIIPKILTESTIAIHPSYRDALNLRAQILTELTDDSILKQEGILEELPEGLTFDDYQRNLAELKAKLAKLSTGIRTASKYEDLIGEVIKLCFFRSLTNVQPKSRTLRGVTIRDWISSNRAKAGFWEQVRSKHGATQVVWECKNYIDLKADDFQQICYYLNNISGRFAIIVYRGTTKPPDKYIAHLQRIASKENGAVVLLLNEKDVNVFLRQAMNGKSKDDHINEQYDAIVRAIS